MRLAQYINNNKILQRLLIQQGFLLYKGITSTFSFKKHSIAFSFTL